MNVCYSLPDGVVFRHYAEGENREEFEGVACLSENPGPDESNHSAAKVQNACGIVILEDSRPTHCAWHRTFSIFGVVRKAYTLAGNLILQRDRISFKGATTKSGLHRVVRELVMGDFVIKLQLLVLAAGIGRCLSSHVDSFVERRLRELSWVRVMGRCEEICNVVLFYVRDWRAMEQAINIERWAQPPKSTTVSVTRRGTMTVRLTWESVDWEDNALYESMVGALANFVRDLA